MKNYLPFVTAFAAISLLSGCSAKDEVCDMTGAKYQKMEADGTPLSEKDKACLNAISVKKWNEQQEERKKEIERIQKM